MLLIMVGVAMLWWLMPEKNRSPIRVGVLHSLTGTMAISEKPVVDATLLAIAQINQAGGLLGRKIEAIVVDGKSDAAVFGREAERLIVQEHVAAIFGCWTSASRKNVKQVVEKYHHLLFYPLQYEGFEASPNIIYMGAVPNQQIIPAVHWALTHLGKRIYLIGSDYVFPRVANWLIRKQVQLQGGTIVGERYLLLGTQDVDATVREIAALKPDVILNTINGDSNLAFFHALAQAGMTAQDWPVMSFSMGEAEVASMKNKLPMQGYYAAWSYFQSIDSVENRTFIAAFKQKYGDERVLSDPMEAAWVGVQLWADAVRNANTDSAAVVSQTIQHRSMHAPEGTVSIDHATHHLWKKSLVGKLLADGQFEIVWSSEKPIAPEPYPSFVSKLAAKQYMTTLQQGWSGRWEAVRPAKVNQP
ncbi:MAG: urea ABC transporter substrate-binding protein [Mariprofundus sp.]|nr:urea ABC transporter substrate-binding protein [Mariprofundus sp.]